MVKKSENMVDKNSQWDDLEHTEMQDMEDIEDFDDSEFNEGEDASDQEYSEQDYEEDEEEDDVGGNKQSSQDSSKKKNLFLLLVLGLLLFGIGGFFALSASSNKNVKVADNQVNADQSVDNGISVSSEDKDDFDFGDDDFLNNDSSSSQSSEDEFFGEEASSDMVGMNFDDNGSATTPDVANSGENNTDFGDDFDSFSNQNETTNAQNSQDENNSDLFSQADFGSDGQGNENNDIIISYDKVGRTNPFKPPVTNLRTEEIEKNYKKLNDTDFEIVEPPIASIPDENLTRLLQTQISGILYDEDSPSAIVNLNGEDTFVRVGDYVSGYRIQAITKDKVQINYKNNSYVAAVGELFVKGSIEGKSAVANLEKKFAGRYKD